MAHEYTSCVIWTGNRGEGTAHYRAYDRTWDIAVPGKPVMHCSNDPLLGGDPAKMNPEDLLLSALSAQIAAGALDGGKFCPHPATWLNGGRWLDEPPETSEAAILRAVGIVPADAADNASTTEESNMFAFPTLPVRAVAR